MSVTTWQADNSHTGNNSKETILTPGTVSSPGNFGLLFTQTLDGQTYGQPLVAAGVQTTDGTTHNVVYVATQRCNLYAFDADSNTGANASALWHTALLPAGTVPCRRAWSGRATFRCAGHHDHPGHRSEQQHDLHRLQSAAHQDTTYHQYPLRAGPGDRGREVRQPGGNQPYLHRKFLGPHESRRHPVQPVALRTCAGSMALNNGILYLAYASHSDTTPYHGEIVAYNAGTLQLLKTFNAMPLATLGGIWMSGAGPAIDADGNVFVATGNGNWGDPNNASATTFPAASYPYGTDYSAQRPQAAPGHLQRSPLPTRSTGSRPITGDSLNNGDLDLGCGGITLLPDQTGPAHPHPGRRRQEAGHVRRRPRQPGRLSTSPG